MILRICHLLCKKFCFEYTEEKVIEKSLFFFSFSKGRAKLFDNQRVIHMMTRLRVHQLYQLMINNKSFLLLVIINNNNQ
jgi:hypothetical protein